MTPSRSEVANITHCCVICQAAKAKGILVVAVTQCLKGGVNLGAYAVGVALERNGVISGGDMTTEACSTKLAYLFSLTNDIQVHMACGAVWVSNSVVCVRACSCVYARGCVHRVGDRVGGVSWFAGRGRWADR